MGALSIDDCLIFELCVVEEKDESLGGGVGLGEESAELSLEIESRRSEFLDFEDFDFDALDVLDDFEEVDEVEGALSSLFEGELGLNVRGVVRFDCWGLSGDDLGF